MNAVTFQEQQQEYGFDTGMIASLKEAAGSSIITALKDERPCLACGQHPCPPGSSFRCTESMDILPNISQVIRPALETFANQYGHPY